jgi:S1-C subfamily serine protease
MKTIFGTLLVAAAMLATVAISADFTAPRRATVELWVPESKTAHCAAVAIGKKEYLTAAHCIPLGMPLGISDETTTRVYPVKVLKVDPQRDLALLSTDDQVGVPISIANASPRLDADVVVVGQPMGITEVATVGHIAGERPLQYLVTAPAYYGNSGGGLFVREGGSWVLAGIASQVATFKEIPITHLGLFTKLSEIKKLLGPGGCVRR